MHQSALAAQQLAPADVGANAPPRLSSAVRATRQMSNQTLKARIEEAVRRFEAGEIDLVALKSSVLVNGRALEAMPYEMIKEIDSIEYKLTVSQFYEEEGCEVSPELALTALKTWLKDVSE